MSPKESRVKPTLVGPDFLLEHHQLLGRISLENLGKQKDDIFFVWRNNEANLDTESVFLHGNF